MRKRLVDGARHDKKNATDRNWLDLDSLAEVELTSEDSAHPIEAALLQEEGAGWRAAGPGEQSIRLLFAEPQRLSAIQLGFIEKQVERTQEYWLRWSADGGQNFQEIVRQQWNFSPSGETAENETHEVALDGVTVLELGIRPDIGNRDRVATLQRLRVA